MLLRLTHFAGVAGGSCSWYAADSVYSGLTLKSLAHLHSEGIRKYSSHCLTSCCYLVPSPNVSIFLQPDQQCTQNLYHSDAFISSATGIFWSFFLLRPVLYCILHVFCSVLCDISESGTLWLVSSVNCLYYKLSVQFCPQDKVTTISHQLPTCDF